MPELDEGMYEELVLAEESSAAESSRKEELPKFERGGDGALVVDSGRSANGTYFEVGCGRASGLALLCDFNSSASSALTMSNATMETRASHKGQFNEA